MQDRKRHKKVVQEEELKQPVASIDEQGLEYEDSEEDADAQADAYINITDLPFVNTDEMLNEIERLNQVIRDLKTENDGLRQRIYQLQGEVQSAANPAPNGMSGYIIETPKPFNGMFAGVLFQNGRGFVPSYRKDVAMMMHNDFGYRVTETDNYIP